MSDKTFFLIARMTALLGLVGSLVAVILAILYREWVQVAAGVPLVVFLMAVLIVLYAASEEVG